MTFVKKSLGVLFGSIGAERRSALQRCGQGCNVGCNPRFGKVKRNAKAAGLYCADMPYMV